MEAKHWEKACQEFTSWYNLYKLRFTLYKDEQPLQDMGLKEKREDKDEKHIGKLIMKSQNITGVYNSNLKAI